MGRYFDKNISMRILLLCISFLFSAISMAQTENKPSEQMENATVFIMRSSGYTGSAVPYSVFVDDILVCRLMNQYYSAHLIAPGVHKFSVQFSGKKSKGAGQKLSLNLEAGKKYFIKLVVEQGAFSSKIYCEEITENSAKQAFKNLQAADTCN